MGGGLTGAEVPAGALAEIWERHREGVLARLDAIDRGTMSGVTPQARDEALSAAHQLAGTVGTFGFTHATVLARELEAQLAAPGAVTPELNAVARRLRRELIGAADGA